ncbi:ABC transporter permease, partial [bacterium]|nr:ABC transporter permease [bacterium]
EGLYFESRTETDDHSFYRIAGDFNFIDLFRMKLMAGRTFDRTVPTDLNQAYIVNEAAVKAIGWEPEDAIGKAFGNRDGRLIGVVGDFNFRSLKKETLPLAINVMPRMFQYVSVRIKPGDIPNTIEFLDSTWKRVNQGLPFEYYFYDEEFDKLYKSDEKLQTLFGYFAGLAIFIACLGLFGLSMFTVQQKTKEIGIRKVLGASVPTLINVLLAGLFRLVALAALFASPIAYLAMNSWLQDFAYRINPGLWTFLMAAVLALIIAVLTVGYQVLRAALANPVKALRYE